MNVRQSQILIILLSSLFLFSCGTTIKPIDVSVNQVERAPLILPQVDKFAPGDVDWWIISDETAEERFVEMQEAGYDPVIFGLTDEGYKNLSLNVKNIMKLIQQQQAVIDAYEEYYKKESKDGTDNTGTTE